MKLHAGGGGVYNQYGVDVAGRVGTARLMFSLTGVWSALDNILLVKLTFNGVLINLHEVNN